MLNPTADLNTLSPIEQKQRAAVAQAERISWFYYHEAQFVWSTLGGMSSQERIDYENYLSLSKWYERKAKKLTAMDVYQFANYLSKIVR